MVFSNTENTFRFYMTAPLVFIEKNQEMMILDRTECGEIVEYFEDRDRVPYGTEDILICAPLTHEVNCVHLCPQTVSPLAHLARRPVNCGRGDPVPPILFMGGFERSTEAVVIESFIYMTVFQSPSSITHAVWYLAVVGALRGS